MAAESRLTFSSAEDDYSEDGGKPERWRSVWGRREQRITLISERPRGANVGSLSRWERTSRGRSRPARLSFAVLVLKFGSAAKKDAIPAWEGKDRTSSVDAPTAFQKRQISCRSINNLPWSSAGLETSSGRPQGP